MPDTNQITRPTQYASSADFQKIFEEEMNDLYLLSFLLTADREKAEQCFVSGLEDAVEGNHVFKEWARSWARRVIIQNAVRVINPQPAVRGSRQSSAAVSGNSTGPSDEQPFEIAAVLRLEPFERFVYVMTVLERYSDQDTSVLLGCARRDVLTARIRGLQQTGAAGESRNTQVPNASSPTSATGEPRSPLLQLLVGPRLATSA
jgi:DNA-directed RNA polymerase specialized sigma24 family protein